MEEGDNPVGDPPVPHHLRLRCGAGIFGCRQTAAAAKTSGMCSFAWHRVRACVVCCWAPLPVRSHFASAIAGSLSPLPTE